MGPKPTRPPGARVEIGTIGGLGEKKTVDMSKKDFDSAVADYMSGVAATSWTSQEWTPRQELIIIAGMVASNTTIRSGEDCRRVMRIARSLLAHLDLDDPAPLLEPALPRPEPTAIPSSARPRAQRPLR